MSSPNSIPSFPSTDLTSESNLLLKQAWELLEHGRLEESEIALRKVIELAIYPADGFYGLGLIALQRKNPSSATANFQKSLELRPRNANAYYFLGQISEQQNLRGVALEYYKKALEIDPGHQGATRRIGASVPVIQGHTPTVQNHRNESHAIQHDEGRVTQPDEGHVITLGPRTDSGTGLRKKESNPTSAVRESGIYEYIRSDPSPLAKQTLSLMDSLTIEPTTPRLSAYYGGILSRLLAAFFVPLLAYTFVIPGLLRTIFPNPRTWAAMNAKIGSFLAIALFAFAISMLGKALRIVLNVKNSKYSIDKGRVVVSWGVFSKFESNWELYRVEDVEIRQSFFNRLTKDGFLVLHFASGHGPKQPMFIGGIAGIDRLRVLFDQLRNLILLLRTGMWGKGVIY